MSQEEQRGKEIFWYFNYFGPSIVCLAFIINITVAFTAKLAGVYMNPCLQL